MTEFIFELLGNNNIEYISVLPFDKCEITNQNLLIRNEIEPKSAVIFLIPYFSGFYPQRNISLYAVPKDYHLYLSQLKSILSSALEKEYPQNKFAFFSDHSPINEVKAAALSGLGCIGDNHLLINEKYGSFVFIGELITDAVLSPMSVPETIKAVPENGALPECMHCGSCKAACPSPQKCLSAITQTKGELDESSKQLIVSCKTAWGCDICQTCCQMSKAPCVTPIDFFKKDLIPYLTPEALENMSDEEFASRAYAWKKRGCIMRNLQILSQTLPDAEDR